MPDKRIKGMWNRITQEMAYRRRFQIILVQAPNGRKIFIFPLDILGAS